MNTYIYVAANPLKYTDPTGKCIEDFCIGETIAAATWCAANPACAGGVLAITGGAIYSQSNNGPKANLTSAASAKTCSPDNKDPCDEIRKKIQDLEQKLASKERQMAENKYDLFNRAYDTNPGGDLAGKGTWVGHLAQIEGLRVGLERARAQARAMGCL